MNKIAYYVTLTILSLVIIAGVGNALSGNTKAENTDLKAEIKRLHEEKAAIELQIAETKPVCAKLEQHRIKRQELENQINLAINNTEEKVF